jgi:hypothetical protein
MRQLTGSGGPSPHPFSTRVAEGSPACPMVSHGVFRPAWASSIPLETRPASRTRAPACDEAAGSPRPRPHPAAAAAGPRALSTPVVNRWGRWGTPGRPPRRRRRCGGRGASSSPPGRPAASAGAERVQPARPGPSPGPWWGVAGRAVGGGGGLHAAQRPQQGHAATQHMLAAMEAWRGREPPGPLCCSTPGLASTAWQGRQHLRGPSASSPPGPARHPAPGGAWRGVPWGAAAGSMRRSGHSRATQPRSTNWRPSRCGGGRRWGTPGRPPAAARRARRCGGRACAPLGSPQTGPAASYAPPQAPAVGRWGGGDHRPRRRGPWVCGDHRCSHRSGAPTEVGNTRSPSPPPVGRGGVAGAAVRRALLCGGPDCGRGGVAGAAVRPLDSPPTAVSPSKQGAVGDHRCSHQSGAPTART